MLRGLMDAVSRLLVGNNTTDNLSDWHQAHEKANQSRAEAEQIIKDAELVEATKKDLEKKG